MTPRSEDVRVRRVGDRFVLRFEDGSTAIARSADDALALALTHAIDRGEVEKPVMRLPTWEALPVLLASALLMVGVAAAIWRAL